MSLFRHYHKLKVCDNFAFVGPAGEPPKPINDTEFSKAIHAPYAGKAWKIKKGTQTFIIQQYANPNKRGLWEIVNMDNMSRVMENAKLSDIKKYVFDTFGIKLVDKRIADRDFNVESVAGTYKYKPENKKYYVLYGNYSDNPSRKVFLFTGNYDPVKKYSTGSGTILNSQQEVNNFIKEFGESIVRDELIQSSSKEVLGKNIATEIKSGKEPKQAAAIAYSIQNENLKDAQGYVLCKTDTDYKGIKSKRYVAYYTDYYKTYGTQDPNEAALFNNVETAKAWKNHLARETNWDIVPSSIGTPIKSKRLGDKNVIKDELGYHPDICGCMDFTDIENIVHTTIQYIKAKYPNEQNTMEKWLSLIGEEFGELCQAINDGSVNNVIEEGTQTIAAIYLMLSDFVINANVLANTIK